MTFLVTTTAIRGDEGNYTGLVLVFEDLTELQRAERAAAWREVARRMAHEIKILLLPFSSPPSDCNASTEPRCWARKGRYFASVHKLLLTR